jgi:hypothetical protein
MRKFLELARMTLKEDIVAVEDTARVYEFSTAAEKSPPPRSLRLKQSRNACPGTP